MLAEVEAVLNTRPIAPLSPDTNDGEALTPALLRIGECLRSYGSEPKLWKCWRLLYGPKQTFWQAWSRDYVLDLQGKAKWMSETPNLKIGHNSPRGQLPATALDDRESR